jgi:hypothetical protein
MASQRQSKRQWRRESQTTSGQSEKSSGCSVRQNQRQLSETEFQELRRNSIRSIEVAFGVDLLRSGLRRARRSSKTGIYTGR